MRKGLKGRVFVRHTDDIKVIHRGDYLRIEGISIEFTKEWEDAADYIHKAYQDEMWRITLERIIRIGLKNAMKKPSEKDNPNKKEE